MSDFWTDVVSTIIGAGVGAFLAFELERRRRNAEELRDEIGRCHQLACLLINRLNTLEEFNDYLFAEPERRLGRPVEWNEVYALDGAPEREQPFVMGDYIFLIDGREHESNAPGLLRKLQLADTNMNALLYRLSRRNRLWHEWEDAQSQLTVANDATAILNAKRNSLAAALKELTDWLRDDFKEEIATCHEIFDVYYAVMRDRYPKQKLLRFKPLAGGPQPGDAAKK